MYRAVAAASAGGADPAEVARSARLELGERVRLDGEDVTERIREPWVSEAASRVSADPAVREALVAQQRRILESGRLGRRGPRHRHRRRARTPTSRSSSPPRPRSARAAAPPSSAPTPSVVLREQTMRDERDRSREHSPLAPAADAVPVDTTGLSLEEVVDQIVTLAVEAKELRGGPT